jgi:hypothetical protein
LNRSIFVVVGVLLGGGVLTACGSTTTSAASTTAPRASSTPKHGIPKIAASGTIAAVSLSSSSMQVQGTATGETTVDWTSTTRFTQAITISPSAIAIGSCVSAIEHTPRGSSIAVIHSITVTTGKSTCANPPTVAKKAKHHGSHSHRRPKGHRLIRGTVTAVSSTSITISESATSKSTAQSVTLPLTKTIRIIAHQIAASTDLIAGRCVIVQGSTSSIGVVTARRIGISQPTNGSCKVTKGTTSPSTGSTGA